MNLINERWKRVLICLFFAGFLSAGISCLTNKHVKIAAFLSAIILYALLSKIYRKAQKPN